MSRIHLKHLNEVHARVECDAGTLMELAEHLTYKAENYKFHPRYRARVWDGNICLVQRGTRTVYKGLAHRIKKFCDERDYTFSFDDEFLYENVSEKEVIDFISTLNLPFEPRQYQVDAVIKCLRSKRRTLLSPTSSGKSLIAYMIQQWYDKKTLIIVPTIGLVSQLKSDFESYGYKGTFHTSLDGLSKSNNIDCDTVITTWQSLENGKKGMPADWYNQFEVVIGDEAHGAKAASLVKILSQMRNTKYRFGMTGTLDGHPLNEATIEGLFGAKYTTTTTSEMMDRGEATRLKIKCIVLRYPEEVCKDFHKIDPITKKEKTYQEEVDFLTTHEGRTNFIKNLTLSLKGNKLVFFRMKDHGQSIFNAISSSTDHNVLYIDGDVSATTREEIRKAIEDIHYNITLHFNDVSKTFPSGTKVLLSDGSVKLVENITCDDDISDIWICENINI